MALKLAGSDRPSWEIIKFFVVGMIMPKFVSKLLGIEFLPKDCINFFVSVVEQRLAMKKSSTSKGRRQIICYRNI